LRVSGLTTCARRFGVALAAVLAVALLGAATASATAARDASLARRGVTLAVQRHWLGPDEAQRYRAAVTRAMSDVSRLPKLRGSVIAVQLQQVTALWDSYTKPRALALFSQLAENLDYLETHIIPPGRIDVVDNDGVVYRWFPGKGLEFHPLAAFGALNAAALAQDAERTGLLSAALVARGIPRGNGLIWEYSFNFGFGRPPWVSGMAQAVAAQALGRAAVVLEDPTLTLAAVRAYAAVPSLTLQLSAGPWVRLYGFNREVVLNAQLQAVLSLLQYAVDTGDTAAGALAQRLNAAAQALLPRFDTGDWSLYELGGAYATKEYQLFVTQLLAKLAARTTGPVLGRCVAALPRLLLRPAAGDARNAAADDLSATVGRVPRRGADPDHAVAERVGLARGRWPGDDVPPLARAAHTDVDAAGRRRAGNVSRAGLGDEPRRPARHGQALAGCRGVGHGAAGSDCAAPGGDARLAGHRSGHSVACAARRLRRPDRRQPAADRRPGKPAAHRKLAGCRAARHVAGSLSWRRTRRASRARSISEWCPARHGLGLP